MNATRYDLHQLIDIVDNSEIELIYRLLMKFIPEDSPLPDEVEAIRAGMEEKARGEYINSNDINWDE